MFRTARFGWVLLGIAVSSTLSFAQSQYPLTRGRSTIVLEPYAANIVRISMSRHSEAAKAAPGYGFLAGASASGWAFRSDNTSDILESDRLTIKVPKASESLTVATPDGTVLIDLRGWLMNPAVVAGEHTYHVGATFASPGDEHYYGLGQNQEGFLDHRGHPVYCWHNYDAPGGQSVCVPFLVTNRGYGMVWDNPSKTTIAPGFNEVTTWSSEVGERISFFVIAGKTTDEIYSGYRYLTGPTQIPPKSAFGFIQSKQRYSKQEELLNVAKGYRERHYPADILVLDWFYWAKLGSMDMDSKFWPDPVSMNQQLHQMGFQTLISVWPRFEPGSRYFDFLAERGWLLSREDGQPAVNLTERSDFAGSIIPLGEVVEHIGVPQKVTQLLVYAGADGEFDLYQDDGVTYAYEEGDFKLTHFRWKNSARKLAQSGTSAFEAPQSRWLKVVGN